MVAGETAVKNALPHFSHYDDNAVNFDVTNKDHRVNDINLDVPRSDMSENSLDLDGTFSYMSSTQTNNSNVTDTGDEFFIQQINEAEHNCIDNSDQSLINFESHCSQSKYTMLDMEGKLVEVKIVDESIQPAAESDNSSALNFSPDAGQPISTIADDNNTPDSRNNNLVTLEQIINLEGPSLFNLKETKNLESNSSNMIRNMSNGVNDKVTDFQQSSTLKTPIVIDSSEKENLTFDSSNIIKNTSNDDEKKKYLIFNEVLLWKLLLLLIQVQRQKIVNVI